jgi:hypothetical protein
MIRVRLVGTVIACAVLAFGAAFLIGRAVDHQSSSHHAARPARTTAATNAQLASAFVPQLTSVKLREAVKHVAHHRRAKTHRGSRSSASSAAAAAAAGTAAATTTLSSPPAAPAYTPPAPSTQSHSRAGSGSGTTSVGGSKKSGSGTTSVG